jgi:hypothetical protein
MTVDEYMRAFDELVYGRGGAQARRRRQRLDADRRRLPAHVQSGVVDVNYNKLVSTRTRR